MLHMSLVIALLLRCVYKESAWQANLQVWGFSQTAMFTQECHAALAVTILHIRTPMPRAKKAASHDQGQLQTDC